MPFLPLHNPFFIQITVFLVQRKKEIGSRNLWKWFKGIERQDIVRHVLSIKKNVEQFFTCPKQEAVLQETHIYKLQLPLE